MNNNSTNLKEFFLLIKKTKPNIKIFSFAILLSAFSAVISTLLPNVLKDLIDSYANAKQINISNLLILLGIFLGGGITGAIGSYMLSKVGFKVVANLRKTIWNKVSFLPMDFHDKNQSADIASRLVNDTNIIYNLVSNSFSQFINAILMIIFCGFWLFYYDWQLALIILVAIPVYLIFFIPLGKILSRLSKKTQNITAQLNQNAIEMIISIKLIKAFRAEKYQVKKGEENINELLHVGLKQMKWMALVNPVVNFIMMLIIGTIVGYGGIKLANGSLTPGTFIAFLTLIFYVIGPISNFGLFFTQLQRTAGATERIIQLLSEEEEDQKKGMALTLTGNDLIIKDLSFGYGSKQELVLKKINLTVKGRSTNALVGPSGSGKTTLISLLIRYYKPNSGTINIGEENIESFTIDSWRNKIGYISQDNNLITGNIRENIIFGLEKQPSEEKIIEVCRLANAWEFIEKMPFGLDTDIGERGLKLSGGQRQRIAIARLFLKNPEIILLDEATASLDSRSEEIVIDAVNKILEGRTSIVIAHRLSTIINADNIIFMDNGEITGQGTHWELKKSHELYKRFCEQQFNEQDDPKLLQINDFYNVFSTDEEKSYG